MTTPRCTGYMGTTPKTMLAACHLRIPPIDLIVIWFRSYYHLDTPHSKLPWGEHLINFLIMTQKSAEATKKETWKSRKKLLWCQVFLPISTDVVAWKFKRGHKTQFANNEESIQAKQSSGLSNFSTWLLCAFKENRKRSQFAKTHSLFLIIQAFLVKSRKFLGLFAMQFLLQPWDPI